MDTRRSYLITFSSLGLYRWESDVPFIFPANLFIFYSPGNRRSEDFVEKVTVHHFLLLHFEPHGRVYSKQIMAPCGSIADRHCATTVFRVGTGPPRRTTRPPRQNPPAHKLQYTVSSYFDTDKTWPTGNVGWNRRKKRRIETPGRNPPRTNPV